MTKQEAINLARGKNLDTPTYETRVFHFNNPDYTYEFVRQEGSDVIVVDDHSGKLDKDRTLKTFAADELVNTVIFNETWLQGNEAPLPHRARGPKILEQIQKLPGGDSNPFEIPVGPTKICLSSAEVVSFIENGEKDEDINRHLRDCGVCLDRVNRFRVVIHD